MTTMLRQRTGEALTRAELCEELDVSVTTIWRWEQKGMPVLLWGARIKRYELPKVRSWLDRGGANGNP